MIACANTEDKRRVIFPQICMYVYILYAYTVYEYVMYAYTVCANTRG